MKKTVAIFFLIWVFVNGAVFAAEQACEKCESPYKSVNESLVRAFPNLKFESIQPAGIEGLYEVVAGDNIIYYYPKTEVLIFGEIWTKEGKSLTAERKTALVSKRLEDLPLNIAVKLGSGPNTIIEVADPDCPYCRKASEFFSKRDDVTRYVFFLPLTAIHPEAEKKAKYILCSPDKREAYNEVFQGKLDGKNLSLMPACNDKVQGILAKHIQVAKKLGVRGTPAFWINGQYVAGANIPQIKNLLEKGGERSE